MKKSKLILFALLGLFLFNACNDEEVKEPAKVVETSPTINKVKKLTSVSLTVAETTLVSWGYANAGAVPIDGYSVYSFEASNKTDKYMLYEKNNMIFASFYMNNAEKTIVLKAFENLSKECEAYMLNKTYIYKGKTTLTNNVTTTFINHISFTNHYASNKFEFLKSEENWETILEKVSSLFLGPDELSYSYKSAIRYVDSQLAPAGFLK